MTVTFAIITLLICAGGAKAVDLEARKHRQVARLHADRGSLRFCKRHPQAHVFCTPRRLRFLHARIRWTTRELRETNAALNPYRVPAWFRAQAECIESHESGGYGWHANTGNGYETGMQFLPSTWLRAGGHIDRDGHFYMASVAEIVYRAYVIWRQDGGSWREWSTAGYCGLA